MRDLELGGNSMDANEVERSRGRTEREKRRGERNTNAASCQFYGSLWWIELSSFGRSEGREGIAATDNGDSGRVGEVTRDTRGEKGTA